MDCSGGTASSWHTRSSEYTCELMETTTVSTKHAWVKAVKFSALRSRSVHKTPPLNKKLHATVTCWPRKKSFLFPNGVSLGIYINYISRQDSRLGEIGQCKMIPMFFMCFSFCFIGFVVCSDFHFFFPFWKKTWSYLKRGW